MIAMIIVSALLIFFTFRIVNYIDRNITYSRKLKHHIGYIIPVLELLVWLIYAIWIINKVYISHNNKGLLILTVIIILLVLPTFFLFKDFIFGVYLKIQQKINSGEFIEFDNVSGEIISTGNFSMEVKDNQGDIKTVPYSRLISKILIRHGTNPNLKKQILIFKFPQNIKIEDKTSELLKSLLNTPWVALSQPPFIENIKIENNEYIVEVHFYTLEVEHIQKIREILDIQNQ